MAKTARSCFAPRPVYVMSSGNATSSKPSAWLTALRSESIGTTGAMPKIAHLGVTTGMPLWTVASMRSER